MSKLTSKQRRLLQDIIYTEASRPERRPRRGQLTKSLAEMNHERGRTGQKKRSHHKAESPEGALVGRMEATTMDFVNALREVLGLDPIQVTTSNHH